MQRCVLLAFACLVLPRADAARLLSEDNVACGANDTCCLFINNDTAWSTVDDKCDCANQLDHDGIIPYK
eukprot:3126411-Prymnesium_polylepis.1